MREENSKAAKLEVGQCRVRACVRRYVSVGICSEQAGRQARDEQIRKTADVRKCRGTDLETLRVALLACGCVRRNLALWRGWRVVSKCSR